MNLHNILATVPPQWHSIAKHYAKVFDAAGVPADKIDRLIQWGLNYDGSGEEGDIERAFRSQATRLGLSSDTTSLAVDLGLSAREKINSGELVPGPAQPDDNAGLLQDIRAFRRQWPDEYDQDHAMQAVERQLIAASLGEDPGPVAAPPTSDAGRRLQEIRQMRRDDPDRYDQDKATQSEELALIQASLPTSEGTPTNE